MGKGARLRDQRRRDAECAAIAGEVYNVAWELKHDGEPEPLPLPVLAPLVAAAERVAPGVLQLAQLPVTEEMAREVASYLVAGFREMAVMFDRQHFEKWRNASDAAASDDGAGD